MKSYNIFINQSLFKTNKSALFLFFLGEVFIELTIEFKTDMPFVL